MKFDVLVFSLLDIMEILNDKNLRFKDVFFYLNFNGRLYTSDKIELRYSEEIDKHAIIITLNND